MIRNVLLDIDGTLLRVSKKRFKERFFELLSKSRYIEALGGSDIFLDAFRVIHHGSGDVSNWQLFINELSRRSGLNENRVAFELDGFYKHDFSGINKVFDPPCDELLSAVKLLKKKGYRLLIATGPVFPESALIMRLNMAGFNERDFSYISSAENSKYYKYDIGFYTELCRNAGILPEESLMVGNDTEEDITAMQIGMECYYITGYELGIFRDECRSGGPEDFLKFVEEMPELN